MLMCYLVAGVLAIGGMGFVLVGLDGAAEWPSSIAVLPLPSPWFISLGRVTYVVAELMLSFLVGWAIWRWVMYAFKADYQARRRGR